MAASETLDSCDASGEYTTGESDVEKQYETSEEDHQSSVATCRRVDDLGQTVSQSNSQEILEERDESDERFPADAASTPKVVMRSKRKSSNGPRPWSVSCITQIRKRSSLVADETIAQFSISETALHQLVTSPPAKSVSLDATWVIFLFFCRSISK